MKKVIFKEIKNQSDFLKQRYCPFHAFLATLILELVNELIWKWMGSRKKEEMEGKQKRHFQVYNKNEE